MASVPSSIIVESKDVWLTQHMLHVVCKQVFRFGVKEISKRKNGQLLINLSYSPKSETLKRKFSKLPVEYFRVHSESSEEFNILEVIILRYSKSIQDAEDVDPSSHEEPTAVASTSFKRPIEVLMDMNKEDMEKKRKITILENRLIKPVSSTRKPVSSTRKPVSSTPKPVSSTPKPVSSIPSSNTIEILNDDDNDDFFHSQKYLLY